MSYTFVVAMTRAEKYKVYAMRPDEQPRMNNTYPLKPVVEPKQPKGGFETIEEAEQLLGLIRCGIGVRVSTSPVGQYLPVVPSSKK